MIEISPEAKPSQVLRQAIIELNDMKDGLLFKKKQEEKKFPGNPMTTLAQQRINDVEKAKHMHQTAILKLEEMEM